MENKTLEKLLRERNSQLTLWLMGPIALSYFFLQGVLFSFDMAEAKSIVARWRENERERITQSLFLQNNMDLEEVVSRRDKDHDKNRPTFKVTILDSRNRIKATNDEELKRGGGSFSPPGMNVDFKRGEIIDCTPLYLAGKLQGHLIIHSRYDWSDLKRESVFLLLACVGLFLVLKLGVWLLILTLRRSVVKPLQRMTEEIAPQLSEFDKLKPLPVEVSEFKHAPEEFLNLVRGYNHLIKNIQELRQKENRFIAGATRVEIATQLAHDIRSPLAALSLAVEELPPLPGRQKEIFLGVMKRMQDIGEELLNTREKKSQNTQKDESTRTIESVGVKGVVESIVQEKQILLSERPDITLRVLEIPDVYVRAGARDLKRALSNLIDNAIESIVASGEVSVKVTEADGKIYLSVRDNGRGISREDRERVWEPGVSLGKANGNGLGLSFVRAVVESWGGRAVLDSAQGRGTVVSLRLEKIV